MIAPDLLAAAFVDSCEDELRAPKPGNVHLFSPGHGMEAQDFIDSARAAASPLTAAGASVGARILGAVEATWARVGQNTNLGILLLCAPLAHAALTAQSADLARETARVLAALDVADADLAFRAITRASPAGLGSAPEHDVAAPARATLLDAMRAAAARDRIAYQYAHDFADIFSTGRASLDASRAQDRTPEMATLLLYLAYLSAFPDSHVARKFGVATAEALRREANQFVARIQSCDQPAAVAAALEWDASLKRRGLNPGTSADLTVATLFADRVGRILAKPIKNG